MPLTPSTILRDPLGTRLHVYLLGLLVWLAIGLAGLVLAQVANFEMGRRVAVAVVPLGNLLMTTWSIFRVVRQDSRHLYLPIVAYLVAVAVYHGYGPLIFTMGSAGEQAYASKFFPVGLHDLMEVLILAQVCQAGVLAGYLGCRTFLGPKLGRWVKRAALGRARLGWLFLLLALWGLVIKYLVQLPADLHLVETKPSGLLVITGYFTYAAHFYFWHEVAERRMKRAVPLLLLLADVSFGVVMLAKTFMLLPILSVILGWQLARPLRTRVWVLLGIGALLLLSVLQPLNAYLRIRRAQGEAVSIVGLVQDLSQFLDRESFQELQTMKQTGDIDTSAHSRLSYVDTMAYGIHEWRLGRPGDSYKHFQYLLIPRFLWPTKPLSEPGLDFTRRVVGHELSYTGITLFGEAYFNQGPRGVVLLCLLLPALLLVLEIPARLVIERGRFEQVFSLFLGVWVGLTADNFAIFTVSSSIVALGVMPIMTGMSRMASFRRGGP